MRGPDVASVRQERVPRESLRTFWPGAPDVAMEVMSPDDTAKEMDVKVAEYPVSRRVSRRSRRSRRLRP